MQAGKAPRTDRAYANIRDKYRFGKWGRRRIVMALRQKNIQSDVIDCALGEIDEKKNGRSL